MFGYVITKNTYKDPKGFWAPFPAFVAFIGRKAGKGWDHWSYRDEKAFRADRDMYGIDPTWGGE